MKDREFIVTASIVHCKKCNGFGAIQIARRTTTVCPECKGTGRYRFSPPYSVWWIVGMADYGIGEEPIAAKSLACNVADYETAFATALRSQREMSAEGRGGRIVVNDCRGELYLELACTRAATLPTGGDASEEESNNAY